jgi:hypothetical protein
LPAKEFGVMKTSNKMLMSRMPVFQYLKRMQAPQDCNVSLRT